MFHLTPVESQVVHCTTPRRKPDIETYAGQSGNQTFRCTCEFPPSITVTCMGERLYIEILQLMNNAASNIITKKSQS